MGSLVFVLCMLALGFALWRADDLEDARHAGWVRKGQGRGDE